MRLRVKPLGVPPGADDGLESGEGPVAVTTPRVEVFSTPTCRACADAKEFLSRHNVAYVDHNVIDDLDARTRMMELSGRLAVPVIVVGDEVMVGFDAQRLKELLNL